MRVEVTLRRCIETYVAKFFMIGLLLVTFVSPVYSAVESVKEYALDSWPHTIYYLAVLSGPNAPYNDITVHITAMDSYTLYVNGELIGSDNDWKTVEAWPYDCAGSEDIVLAVKVDNSGMSGGNGIMVDIDAGTDWIGTTTLKRRSAVISGSSRILPVLWYYYIGDIVELMGDQWYTLINPITKKYYLDETNTTDELDQVMKGNIDESQLNYHHDTNIEAVAGYIGNVDLGGVEGGGIQLRRIEGENIALKKPCQILQLVDGDPTNAVWSLSGDPIGVTKDVDLEDVYRVNRFVMYTGGPDSDKWTQESVRGFAVDISLDRFSWEEVGLIHDVGITNALTGGYNYAIVDFHDEWARYVRFRITEVRPGPPKLGEIMVYGVGWETSGEYESEWLGFGSLTTPKTFDGVDLAYVGKAGTKITLQTKTAIMADDTTFVKESDWSDEYTVGESKFKSPEPATMMKYRVKLSSMDIFRTPAVTSLSFTYSDIDQPLISADGYISPNHVFMGRDTTFVYTLSYQLLTGENLKYLAFAVPSYSTLNYVVCTDSAYTDTLTVDNGKVSFQPVADTLYVVLSDSLLDSDGQGPDSLYVSFNSKLMSYFHSFNAFMFNTALNDGAGGVKVWQNTDLGSWTVSTTGFIEGFLSDVKAAPKVFTPNGDNVNDFTTIEFTLSKIAAKTKIKIFDTNGSLVRMLLDKKLDPGEYFITNKTPDTKISASNLEGAWDGKDDDGELVPPGIYFFQIVLDTDSGLKTKSGTVVVAY